MKKITLIATGIAAVMLLAYGVAESVSNPSERRVLKPTTTRTLTRTATLTHTPLFSATPSDTPTLSDTPSITPTSTDTPDVTPSDTLTPVPTSTPGPVITPYPSAPLCPSHDTSLFHSLWDSERGCHYTHEHGAYPFAFIATAFPDLDASALLCGYEISHCNPSSEMENTHKHGGHKWQVTHNPNGCVAYGAFANATLCVIDAAIQYHAFGDYSAEMPARFHSAVAFLRICPDGQLNDCGSAFISQLVDFGQCVSPYQGDVIPCVSNPSPSYDAARAPYAATDCVSSTDPRCRPSRQFVLNRDANVNSIWTTHPQNVDGSDLFVFLYRVRDAYQLYVSGSNPIVFAWLCSSTSGVSYTALIGCRYNNSTTTVQEIGGTIPDTWDNLATFDTNPEIGIITAQGYVTDFGLLNTECSAPASNCHPIQLVNVPVGIYGAHLIDDKDNQFDPVSQPERDIYFCGMVVCSETSPDAVSSGWIGAEN